MADILIVEHLQTIPIGHAQIGDDQVEGHLRQGLGRGLGAFSLNDAMPALAQKNA
jgi:hypothetical protein